ncbi:MAG TPA: Uma2 family endonuclease [Bryobacteraceae bacterium]|jgi:Uma2 family endonuclease|nr:Uma2 family endonuclease [Bryobacteraceae bacterium]
MATSANTRLSLKEFRCRYAGEKPSYEYWFGEAIQKPMPTWLHTILCRLLVERLRGAGYKSGQEVELRFSDDWCPVPDVIGAQRIEQPYPTTAVDVVAEVLSPEDRMQRIWEKCEHYEGIGIPTIFVLDPKLRRAWEWNRSNKNLEVIERMSLPNGREISVEELWLELDQDLSSD